MAGRMDAREAAGEDMRGRRKTWRQAHPQATFDEIEDAVQHEIVRLQAVLVDELLHAGDGKGERAAPAVAERPVCPTCGAAMRPCGQRQREVLSRMGQPVRLERDYYVCSACGAGLFPPR